MSESIKESDARNDTSFLDWFSSKYGRNYITDISPYFQHEGIWICQCGYVMEIKQYFVEKNNVLVLFFISPRRLLQGKTGNKRYLSKYNFAKTLQNIQSQLPILWLFLGVCSSELLVKQILSYFLYQLHKSILELIKQMLFPIYRNSSLWQYTFPNFLVCTWTNFLLL